MTVVDEISHSIFTIFLDKQSLSFERFTQFLIVGNVKFLFVEPQLSYGVIVVLYAFFLIELRSTFLKRCLSYNGLVHLTATRRSSDWEGILSVVYSW